MKTYLIERLKEPSTWRGLVLVATSAGCAVTPAMADVIVTLGIGLAGLLGIVTADKSKQNTETTEA